MKNYLWLILVSLTVSGCARTDIQPLSKSSFKVATSAAQVCGSSGARLVANQAAAIQVVRMGGDRFIFVSDQGGTELQGIYYDQYSGFQTINRNNQSMVVQMISKGQPNYNDALSAREILGPDWQEKTAKGIPLTCTN